MKKKNTSKVHLKYKVLTIKRKYLIYLKKLTDKWTTRLFPNFYVCRNVEP